MPLTYNSYLQLDALLELQKPHSDPPEHDEIIFIVTHQVYELWFKLMLHEFEKIKRDLSADRLWAAVDTFKRQRMIMKTLVGQLDILETMTPMSFKSFRDRLDTASGFQSAQFRELEFLYGMKRKEMLQYQKPGNRDEDRLKKRLGERSLVDHFYDFLAHRGVKIPAALRSRDAAEPTIPDETIQEGILALYRNSPETAVLFESMVDFDEGQQEWRYRHVKLVERTIGNKKGTGGSLGLEFLKKSLFKPIFPDLWAVRHSL